MMASPSRESIATNSSGGGSINLPSNVGPCDALSRDISQVSLCSVSSNVSQLEECFKCRGHADKSLTNMSSFLQMEQLCDVVLIAGPFGRRIPAHRLVLAAASPYFEAMFTGSLREAEEQEITLRDVDGDTLYSLVKYCYTGTIELREESVETILTTSCLLQLEPVTRACSSFLAQQLHPSNCLGIAVFAEHQSCNELLNQAKAFTSEHFIQVIRNQEFLQLTVDQLGQLLSCDDLNVPSEQDVFHALMSWVKYDTENRQLHLPALLGHIKLPLLEPSFIVDYVETVCQSESKCQQLILEAFKWHLLPERRAQLSSPRTRPRKATCGRLLVIGGMDANKGAVDIDKYCPRRNRWSHYVKMNGRRLQFGVAILGDKLVIVGGRDGLKTLNIVECYDFSTGNWSLLPPMVTHRHGLGVAVLDGPLYAVGGHDGWSYLNTVERWDPAARVWTYVAPMHSQRSTAGVAVLNNRLYAVGGRDGSECLRKVECYDPHTNRWTPCAPMIKRRGGVAVAVCNGYLYAMGGHDAPASNPAASRFDCVERYDPEADMWIMVASLSSKRDAIGACVLGDRIVAVGGYNGSQYLTDVEEYDPIENKWTRVASLLSGRANACVAAIKSELSHSIGNMNSLLSPDSLSTPTAANDLIKIAAL